MKVDLVKMGRCAVCGALLEEMSIAEGLTTCSLLCSNARINGRSRDEQEKHEMMNKKLIDIENRKKTKRERRRVKVTVIDDV